MDHKKVINDSPPVPNSVISMAGALGLKLTAQAYIITLVQIAIRMRAIIMILERVRVFQSIAKSPPVPDESHNHGRDYRTPKQNFASDSKTY
jgi:hypothetical protein